MARTTLSQLRNILRGLTEAGTAEYTLGTLVFWDDDQLDTVLDRYRTDHVFEDTTPRPTTGSGGVSVYNDYLIDAENIETTDGGTAVFWLQDSTGANVGTALYSIDYLRGQITFAADTGGSTYFWNGRTYDLNAAAADVWRKKAGHYHAAFSFSTDNHKVDRNQIYQHCVEMAETYESFGAQSVVTMQVLRSDTDVI